MIVEVDGARRTIQVNAGTSVDVWGKKIRVRGGNRRQRPFGRRLVCVRFLGRSVGDVRNCAPLVLSLLLWRHAGVAAECRDPALPDIYLPSKFKMFSDIRNGKCHRSPPVQHIMIN